MIFSLFGKNIHHNPTLPSLAFAIFRSNFMDEENIPQLSGKIAEDIRSGYTGGAVDMYIPENLKNTKIKSLDVNALYPSQMATQKMPIGVDPLKYGKLIEQIDNKFIITLTTPTNIAVITKINNENFVKIFRKGELMFEYKEFKISDIRFIRTIQDQRYTFENYKLISTEILNA